MTKKKRPPTGRKERTARRGENHRVRRSADKIFLASKQTPLKGRRFLEKSQKERKEKEGGISQEKNLNCEEPRVTYRFAVALPVQT